MLPTKPTFERVALNRATFGARDTDEAYVNEIGWPAWVAEQLAPPEGDDPALAEHRSCTLSTRRTKLRTAAGRQ